jgi:hypothetical protein
VNLDDKKLLELLGIEIDGKHISIDFEKAKSNLKNIKDKLDETAQKIKNDLNEGKIEIPAVGIDVTPQRFEVDIQKTKESIESLLEKLSSLSVVDITDEKTPTDYSKPEAQEENKEQNNQALSFLFFEIESKSCDKDKIAKIIGLESTSQNSWQLATPKVKEDEFNLSKMAQNIVGILRYKTQELKEIQKECDTKMTLRGDIYLKSQKSLSLSDEVLSFLAEFGVSFEINVKPL